MKLLSLSPMLAVRDLKRTRAFYEVLGFRLNGVFPSEDAPVWCELVRDAVAIMFTQPPAECFPADLAKAQELQIFYFTVDDVVALHADFRRRGVQATDLRVTVYAMKEFEVRDPDHYWLWFAQHTDEPPTEKED